MALRCARCGSKDLWQPRRYKSTFDHVLAMFGYERMDCRNCKKRSIFPDTKRNHSRKTSTARKFELSPAEPLNNNMDGSAPAERTIIGPSMVINGEVYSRELIQV